MEISIEPLKFQWKFQRTIEISMEISMSHLNFNGKINKPLKFQWIFVCPTGHWARISQPEFLMTWAWSAHIRHRFPYVEISMEIWINQLRSANTGHNFTFRCNQRKSSHTRHCVSELIAAILSASRVLPLYHTHAAIIIDSWCTCHAKTMPWDMDKAVRLRCRSSGGLQRSSCDQGRGARARSSERKRSPLITLANFLLSCVACMVAHSSPS